MSSEVDYQRFRFVDENNGDVYMACRKESNKTSLLFKSDSEKKIIYNDKIIIVNNVDYTQITGPSAVQDLKLEDFIREWGLSRINGYSFIYPSDNFHDSLIALHNAQKGVNKKRSKSKSIIQKGS